MRLIFIRILFVFFCLSFFSCKKKIDEDYRPEFIGDWYCPFNIGSGTSDFGYNVKIDSNNNSTYQAHTYHGDGSTFTGIARANNKHLKIGRMHSFKIVEYPHKIDTALSEIYANIAGVKEFETNAKKANWKMTLEGPIFYAGSGDYYKTDY